MTYLIAIDGSEQSYKALAHACTLADDTDASLVAIYAVGPAMFSSTRDAIGSGRHAEQTLRDQVKKARQRGEAALDDAVNRTHELGHDLEIELVYGDPIEQIVEFAEEQRIDAIFVGHRGREDRPEWFLGSVAKGIAERASVPTTIVR